MKPSEKKNNFNYCRTGHSLQGTTINDDITIFDYNLPFITRKWLWVSITRSRSLKQIKFYNGKDNDLSDKLLDKYFKNKIAGYMESDKKAKFNITPDDYINVEWLKNGLGKMCCRCSRPFNIYVKNCNVYSDLTANRIDNEEAHHIDNIEYCCTTCNSSLSNR